MKKTTAYRILASLCLAGNLTTQAEPIDLTETTGGFTVSEPSLVSFGPNINEATLLEDPLFGATFLSNDPFLGDSGILVPNDISTLSFDYELSTSGSDNFEVSVLDPSGGPAFFSFFFDGILSGPGTFSGNDVMFDLGLLGLGGATIGLEFVLTSNFMSDSTTDAVLIISDVRFNRLSAPEPGILTLMLAGLLGLAYARRRTEPAIGSG